MQTAFSCVRLPFLRGPLPDSGAEDADAPAVSASEGAPAAALLLWPGLPQTPQSGVYCPADYPFNPREAAACLEDLRQMGDAALSGLPVGATAAGNPRAARHASEMALLRELDGADTEAALKAEAARKLRIEREQAQKALIWVWLQEERMAELADMAQALAQKSCAFTRSLGVEDDDAGELCATNAHAGAGILGAPVALDLGLMPSWKMATANAMYFLPPDMPILAEGSMAQDLLEELKFVVAPEIAQELAQAVTPDVSAAVPPKAAPATAPAPAHAPAHTTEISPAKSALLCARAPAWRALGRSRPTGSLPLDQERLWLVRSATS
ncbi:MAG: hypothetical protein PHI96_10750 [Desulfovibrio sp.]|nr:hypothetical protein [Desulfovibrio sp.]